MTNTISTIGFRGILALFGIVLEINKHPNLTNLRHPIPKKSIKRINKEKKKGMDRKHSVQVGVGDINMAISEGGQFDT